VTCTRAVKSKWPPESTADFNKLTIRVFSEKANQDLCIDYEIFPRIFPCMFPWSMGEIACKLPRHWSSEPYMIASAVLSFVFRLHVTFVLRRWKRRGIIETNCTYIDKHLWTVLSLAGWLGVLSQTTRLTSQAPRRRLCFLFLTSTASGSSCRVPLSWKIQQYHCFISSLYEDLWMKTNLRNGLFFLIHETTF
jgi:hypothetical protein